MLAEVDRFGCDKEIDLLSSVDTIECDQHGQIALCMIKKLQ